MQALFVTIAALVEAIEAERGPFDVKCLAAKDPDDLQWALILSAEWFKTYPGDLTAYLVEHTLQQLDDENLSQMLAVIPYQPGRGGEVLDTLKRVQKQADRQRYGSATGQDFTMIETPHPLARLVVPLARWHEQAPMVSAA
ncbi:hypothetical protein U5801_23995 [Lamprobacter modestohalophilus]|uniref:hypothetical protein n=1 Tax=Lamprobacter modestohalophilus TaxID=1064514 RepID=UPI002ADEEE31|nr:hypothetical protein [Lamprobacter modestohalophilus]MEA1052848.1 hypothetical protein [Lamprobacter modestohalophilus]